ncbi:MAG: hypothetical protein RR505_08165, partial [Raoultibacter sp.]
PDTTYFNFLASHDGIGFRPVLGILDEQERQILLDATVSHGGRIGYKSTLDGGVIPYELNINYMDALTDPSELDDSRLARFMAAQAIMLSMPGLPGIYYHSLLGSRNWSDGMLESGVNRRINREKLKADTLAKELAQKDSLRARVLAAYRVLLRARGASSAFSPYASQTVLQLEPRVFALERFDRKSGERVSVRINVSSEPITLNEQLTGIDLLSEGTPLEALAPYQTRWIRR